MIGTRTIQCGHVAAPTTEIPEDPHRSLGDRLRISAFHWASELALARFLRRTRAASRTNTETLRNILARNRQTEFGRAHDFARMLRDGADPAANFRRRMPLSTYETYAPYIDRIANGEPNILTADPVTLLAGTSGTTDRPKRIPRTRRAQAHHLMLVVLAQQAVVNRGIPGARVAHRGINLMSLYAPAPEHQTTVRLMSGPNAGMARMRQLIPLLWTSPESVFQIEHQPSALYLHALFGLCSRNSLYVETPFAPQVVAWFDLMERQRDRLIGDIGAGSLSDHLQLTAPERASLRRLITPDPRRAQEIAAAFGAGLAGIIPKLWPRMRYIRTVTSGTFGLSLPRLRWLAGPNLAIQSGCHSSSEGVIGLNLRTDGSTDYTLAVGTSYFEFIPFAGVEDAAPQMVNLDELEVGQEYEIVLTSIAGLYRYRLGDIVQMTGRFGTAPVFAYRCRRGTMLNLVGEKTTEWHTTAALEATLNKWLRVPDALVDYTVASSVETGVGQYTFYVELRDQLPRLAVSITEAAALLDDELGTVNYYYRHSARGTERMAQPRLRLVQAGTFAAVATLQRARAHGISATQVKIPRIVNTREQLELLESRVIA